METNEDKESELIHVNELESDKLLLSEIRKKLEDKSIPKLSWQQPENHDSDSDSTCFEFENACFARAENRENVPAADLTADDDVFSLSSPIPRIENEDWNNIIGMLTNDDDTYFSQHQIDPSLDLFEETLNQSLNVPAVQTLSSNSDINKLVNLLPNSDKISEDLFCQTQEMLPLNDIIASCTNETVSPEDNINQPVEKFANSAGNDMFDNNLMMMQTSSHSRIKITDEEMMEIGKSLQENLNIVSSSTSQSSSDVISEPINAKKKSNINCQRGKVQRRQKKHQVKKSQRKWNEIILMSDAPVEECMFSDTSVSYRLRGKKYSSKRKIEADCLSEGDCHRTTRSQQPSSKSLKTRLSDIHDEVRGWLRGWGSPFDRSRAQQLLCEVQAARSMVLSSPARFKSHEVKEFSQVIEKLEFQLHSVLIQDPSANLKHEDETCCSCCELNQEQSQVVDNTSSLLCLQECDQEMIQDDPETQSNMACDFDVCQSDEDSSFEHAVVSSKPYSFNLREKSLSFTNDNEDTLNNSLKTVYSMNPTHKNLNLPSSNDIIPTSSVIHSNPASSTSSNAMILTDITNITQKNLAASTLENPAINTTSKSLFSLKFKEKNPSLMTSVNRIDKNITSCDNENVNSVSEYKSTEISQSLMITDKNNAERISVYNNEQKLVVESNFKQNQMSASDSNESVNNKKLVSILKHVCKNKKSQSSANKRTVGNTAENNMLKMASSFKPGQKNKVIFILGPKKNRHTASDQDCSNHISNSICDSDNSFSLNQGFKRSTSQFESNVPGKDGTSSLNPVVGNNENNSTSVCTKLSEQYTMCTEDVLNYTENSQQSGISSNCVINADCLPEEVVQTAMHINITEEVIPGTKQINKNSSTSHINGVSAHQKQQLSSSETCDMPQNLSRGLDEQLADNNEAQELDTEFGLMPTEAEGPYFVYGIKSIWLHSPSEFVPNCQLPPGFWEDKNASVPQDLLDALEHW